MKSWLHSLLVAGSLLGWASMSFGQAAPKAQDDSGADAHVYKQVGGKDLQLYVFEPPNGDYKKPRGAVVVFHGGGWNQGSAEWAFWQARYFASLGMVGISVEYRLSDGKDVTPVEAVEDARAAIGWVRSHAGVLNIDPKKIAAYGESAGGHLAAAAGITEENASKEELNGVPNALVLLSPALNAGKNERFRKLLRPGQDVRSILPAEHIRNGMPSTIILTGELDTMPSPPTLVAYCDKMKQAHNRCELHIYPGVGHMLEATGGSGAGSDTAAKARYDAYLKADQFLMSLGYLPQGKKN
jgi:acetyl esterase